MKLERVNWICLVLFLFAFGGLLLYVRGLKVSQGLPLPAPVSNQVVKQQENQKVEAPIAVPDKKLVKTGTQIKRRKNIIISE